jgi:hypothetical protein
LHSAYGAKQKSVLKKDLLALLTGADRRSIGRADEVAAMILKHPMLFAELIAGLWDVDRVVRMRAADAVEKVSRKQPELLVPFNAELLGLLAEASEQELRWHLAQMAPRLRLTGKERLRAASLLKDYLDDHSSIVKTFAIQALADLANADPALLPDTVELLEQAVRSGTPAMRARARKLLARLAHPQKKNEQH